jgi:protease IV
MFGWFKKKNFVVDEEIIAKRFNKVMFRYFRIEIWQKIIFRLGFLSVAVIGLFLVFSQGTHYLEKATRPEAIFVGGGTTEGNIFIIPITGAITGRPIDIGGAQSILSSSNDTVIHVKNSLAWASKTPNLKEVILYIESPGGGLAPSDEIHSMIREWKKKHPDVSVSAYFYSMAASGGYYIAMASDTIYSSPTALVGSIGVIMQLYDLKEIAKNIGFNMRTFKSGKLKDMGNPFRDMTKEEEEIFMHLAKQSHMQFVKVVQQGRPKLSSEKIDALADGRIYSAPDALSFGLVDGLSPTFHSFLGERARVVMDRDGDIGQINVILPPGSKGIGALFSAMWSSAVKSIVGAISQDIQTQHQIELR